MGLKARSNSPIEMILSAGGGGFSASATVDLRSGQCSAQVLTKDWNRKNSEWESKEAHCTIPESGLAVLRATAREILREGDTMSREQFAQQGASFTARSQMHSATADFHIDVGSGTRYDGAWHKVFDLVYAITNPK